MALTDNDIYRNEMEFPMESLAQTLDNMGFTDRLTDPELVTVAAKKLKILWEIAVSTGMNKNLLTTIINN